MSDPKDHAQARLQAIPLKAGDRYKHYKGGEYEVMALAIKEDTLEILVLYRSLQKKTVWARTLDDWNATVVVDGQHVQRFTKL